MTVERTIFGTDGVRGVANEEPMTVEVALRLGQAVAYQFRHRRRHGIVIGKDTRLSGYMLETALASGICSMGGDVLLVGPLPTPGVAYITRGMRADAGVMISASHNPYQDNGIKFFDGQGYKLPDAVEQAIEAIMANGALDRQRPTAQDIGRAARIDDAAGRYITFLKSTVPEGMTFDGMKIVVDCAHGAGYRVAPAVLSELGAHVIAIGISPDGRNINRGGGALHPEYVSRIVREHGADCGFALDGDADRVIMCDADGTVVDGDAILALCAVDMQRNGELAHGTVVATTMSNLGLILSLQSLGITVVRANVGDRYVIQEMRAGGYMLGGEQSGHIIFAKHSTTGDGILGALKVLSIMHQTGQSLSMLRAVMQTVPQVLVNVPVREKRPIGDMAPVASLIATYEKELGARGRILVRYSGTEKVARVMIEGERQEQIRKMADTLAGEISQQLGI
ncbi:MAG: phosphoglucosamine mutase [Deltaproteobacteria bacterium]|nr:phosphoglucosamine mutase [Deltaproteobacteria bacterium]